MNPGGTLANQRYRVLRKLAQGGMGAVYLADDTRLPGRKVAVKENLDASVEAQAQFKREAVLLARLEHPNLPRVTDYFIDRGGLQYLVMDYVPGDDLFERIRQHGALPEQEVLACMRQVMAALHYMHTWHDPENGQLHPVIHRDVKPANIKLTPSGRYVLVDFGLAKLGAGGATAPSARAFSPGYAPLEQYHGGTDQRSDVYSLGATLYALVTGQAPPSATSMAAGATLTPARTYNRTVAARIVTVIERAMRLRAEERYQSIDEMHLALFGQTLTPKLEAKRPTWVWGVAGGVTALVVVALLWLLLAGGVQTPPGLADAPQASPTAPWPATQASTAAGVATAQIADAEETAPASQPATMPASTPRATPDEASSATPTVQTESAATASTVPDTANAGAATAGVGARATSTPLGTPASATPAPTPDGTRATSTPLPSPTRRPTFTPTPPAGAGAASTAPPASPTVAATTALPDAAGPTTVRLLFPPDGHSSDVPLVFSWAADAPLAGGQEFEVVFWNPSTEGVNQSRSWVRSTTESSLRIDPTQQAPGSYRWGVFLVIPQPYERLRYLGGGHNFAVAGSSTGDNSQTSEDGASSGGGKPRP